MASIGTRVIYALIWVFGKRQNDGLAPWLSGPTGDDEIGDSPYQQYADHEGLSVERESLRGGLIDGFHRLDGPSFDASAIDERVRDFYERTAEYRMDVWSKTWFPMRMGLRLLVTTISRKVNQLNFPIDVLDTARGMSSEIILLRGSDGEVRYTGWFRRLTGTERVLYTGFYMLTKVPGHPSPCVKVVFPMPRGNATVILRPECGERGELRLISAGRGFGDVGFYRVQRFGRGVRVWRISTLKESFRVYVDAQGILRCDHEVRFLGLPVLTLHYRIERKPVVARLPTPPVTLDNE